MTSGKEYAELEWPIDLLIAVVWVVYGVVFFGTIMKRKVQHIYVANWFFAAYIITIAVLHIVNSAAVPVTWSKSYSLYAGTVDAMVQWWYGHNAVGFFLTAGFLGMMYYFVPKQAGRPVYSYRLSVVHFWALISIYMWAGPHHLHYTSLPDWAQSLGMVFSLMLIAPSWGGMINGIMTLSGAWGKLRTDPILKFLIVSLSFYGMSTFEGPMMSIRTVNALSHYTDWTIGHVHSGALGWVAMVSIGSMYILIPRLYGRKEMFSVKAIDLHFWVMTIGIVLYVAAMWIAGVMQGLMWRATNADGTLTYSFVESLNSTYPFYAIRFLGGVLIMVGMVVMVWNVCRTVTRPAASHRRGHPAARRPAGLRSPCMKHDVIEKNLGLLAVLTALVISVAGLVEIVPLYFATETTTPAPGVKPYTALAAGRPGHLPAGGLLQLPLPDGAAPAVGDGALRPLLRGRRVGLRPPVPVRVEAHGPGPGPRGRPLHRLLAADPPDQSAGRGSRVEHARVSLARRERRWMTA